LRQFGDCSGCTGLLTVFRDGILLNEEPLGQASGIVEGNYRLKADAAPGQYMMQISVMRPRDKKRHLTESRSIDFSVEPQDRALNLFHGAGRRLRSAA
jgi:hypothetical protein